MCVGGGGTSFRASPEPWLKEGVGFGVGRTLLSLRCYWPPLRMRGPSSAVHNVRCASPLGDFLPSQDLARLDGTRCLYRSRCVCSSGLQMRFV